MIWIDDGVSDLTPSWLELLELPRVRLTGRTHHGLASAPFPHVFLFLPRSGRHADGETGAERVRVDGDRAPGPHDSVTRRSL